MDRDLDRRTFSFASAISLVLRRSCELDRVSKASFAFERAFSDFGFLAPVSLTAGDLAFGDALLLDILEEEPLRPA